MKANQRLGWSFILVVAFFSGVRAEGTAYAEDTTGMKRWVYAEANSDDGSQTLSVIDEDTSLREDPTIISQKLVYKERFAAGHEVDLLAAKARFEAEGPTPQKELRLPQKGKPLWIAVKDQWTMADEDAYSAWFTAKADASFLKGTGLKADCADVGLVFRWVYARENKLPIANTLSGSGKLFGHFTGSSAWDKLPTDSDWRKDERFKEALRDLFDTTFTWSITDDQFPTEITRQYVRPGSMYMIIRKESGHTQTIHSITDGNGFVTLWGNEPAAEMIRASSLIVEFSNRRGFLNWRHVRRTVSGGQESWKLIPGKQMPGYSIEQFDPGLGGQTAWMNWILATLGYKFTDEQRFGVLSTTFAQNIDYRRMMTGLGALLCGPGAPCTTNSADYDGYSTFSRDRRLLDQREELRELGAKLGEGNPAVVAAIAALDKKGGVFWGSEITYGDAYRTNGVIESWSSDPNVSFLGRWGQATDASASLLFTATSDLFFEGIRSRGLLVQSAYYLCNSRPCTGNEPSVIALETSRLDGKMKNAYLELSRLEMDPSVDDAAREFVRTRYRGYKAPYATSSLCSGQYSACTGEDLIWKEGAGERIQNWSSNPIDRVNKRWGL